MASALVHFGRWPAALVIAAVVALSLFSYYRKPESTLVTFARVPTGSAQSSLVLVNQTLPDEERPCPAWRMILRLDTTFKPPGPEWMIFEGTRPGEGYELHWLPVRLALQLFRANDQLLLGSVTLDRFPGEVVLARRGFRLEVDVDGKALITALDPLATPAPSAWGFQASGSLGDSTLSLHDDRHVLLPETIADLRMPTADLSPRVQDPIRPERLVLAVRHALGFDPEKNATEMFAALESASVLVDALPADDLDRVRLHEWLAWGEVRWALSRQDVDAADRARAAVDRLDQLVDAVTKAPYHHQVGEATGLLMESLDRLAKRACERPRYRTPPVDVRTRSRTWLSLLSASTQTVIDAKTPAITDDWRWQLRLLMHGADCLRGEKPQPTPAEAPDWLIVRWRAFAGGNPGAPQFVANIPVLPDDRNPIRPALERLVRTAAFEPVAAVQMTYVISNALGQIEPTAKDWQDALTAAKAAPVRESLLARACIALRDPVKADAATSKTLHDLRTALHLDMKAAPPDGGDSWAMRDPLAYALDLLLWVRFPEDRFSAEGNNNKNVIGKSALPLTLAVYARLLSGEADATHDAFLVDPTVLPPAQAFAAAVAMQEIAQVPGVNNQLVSSNWALLEQMPSFTLPLRLIRPTVPAPPDVQPTDGSNEKPPSVP